MQIYYTITIGTETTSFRTREQAQRVIENQQVWELYKTGHAKHYEITKVIDEKADGNPYADTQLLTALARFAGDTGT